MNILNIFAKSKVEQKMENGFFVFDFNKIAEKLKIEKCMCVRERNVM